VLSHHFKTIGLFLGAAVDEKTAAQKPKKVKILATSSRRAKIRATCRLVRSVVGDGGTVAASLSCFRILLVCYC
jgi:hypothetical protein